MLRTWINCVRKSGILALEYIGGPKEKMKTVVSKVSNDAFAAR
jgi:hypothetical protein